MLSQISISFNITTTTLGLGHILGVCNRFPHRLPLYYEVFKDCDGIASSCALRQKRAVLSLQEEIHMGLD